MFFFINMNPSKLLLCTMWGAVALWLEHRTLDQDNPGSNPLAAVSKLGQLYTPHVASAHPAV